MRLTWRQALPALFFVVAGLNHFRVPALYIGMIPPSLPWPEWLNAMSGGAEIVGGLGLLPLRTRRAAGWGLIALLLAVWPANIFMAVHGYRALPAWMLWSRVPLQVVLIAWVYRASRAAPLRALSPACPPAPRA